MTPTQLKAFATIARLGSVRAAAGELGVTEAAVSGNVASLRKELDDPLFSPSRQGLVFTPGGLRLAVRAVELLGLQEQTRREVHEAHDGKRLLRIAATSLFAEFAAPGLIELFSKRADDLEVELRVESSHRFDELLASHGTDVTIGPAPTGTPPAGLIAAQFLKYDVVAVAAPGVVDVANATWFLGPSAVESLGVSRFILERIGVEESAQRIFTSHAAAIAEARNGNGCALAPRFAVKSALREGALTIVDEPDHQATGVWTATALAPDRSTAVTRELLRFVQTPRAIQAMRNGAGAEITRFKPRVHITLWS